MTYSLFFDEKAIDALQKLPDELKKRIVKKLQATKETPWRYFESLEGVTCLKLRVGQYRVFADIDSKKKEIRVLFIGHRRNVYKGSFMINQKI